MNTPIAPPSRLRAIDLLRGLTIAFMIMANNNGGPHAWWAFKHADWNGFTPTDLVFPTFLFLVGVAIVYSTAARLARGDSRGTVLTHALWRAGVLFVFGLVVNSFPHIDLATMRFYGVLQRIAACYLVATAIYLWLPSWRVWLGMIVAALLGYWWLMRFVPVPGLGLPVRDIPLLDPDANLAAWLDRQLFSAAHLYERIRDPEGLLSTLPALATTAIGILAGQWLRSTRDLPRKVRGLLLAGLACVALGALWNLGFPINKKLWTSAYVLFAGGWSVLLLAFFLWAVDIATPAGPDRRPPAWQMPLRVLGTNAIFAYMLSELLAAGLWNIHLADGRPVADVIGTAFETTLGQNGFMALTYALLYLAVCWVPTYVLYRRGIFLKV